MSRRRNKGRRRGIPFVMLLLLLFCVVGFVAGRMPVPRNIENVIETTSESEVTYEPIPRTFDEALPPTVSYDGGMEVVLPDSSPGDSDPAADIVAEMTLDEKIYQMIFTTPESLTGAKSAVRKGDAIGNALDSRPVGGIIYFASNIQSREQVAAMIKSAQECSKIPLFMGVDEEGGRVARISGNPNMGVDAIPPMAQIGASGDGAKAYDVGKRLAGITGMLGFNVDFAPVADITANTDNTEIGDRSFGNDPDMVAKMVKQVVLGLQDNNVCAVLKHFPGYGSAQGNSHQGYSGSSRTLDDMRKEEFVPFREGINGGADFILVSHMSAVNVDFSGKPASLSKNIVTDILKNELGFKGLVITDSLSMGAITGRYSPDEAAVIAVEAGVDVLLMPEDLTEAFTGVKEAVESGRISRARIDESVTKIIGLKLKRGIMK